MPAVFYPHWARRELAAAAPVSVCPWAPRGHDTSSAQGPGARGPGPGARGPGPGASPCFKHTHLGLHHHCALVLSVYRCKEKTQLTQLTQLRQLKKTIRKQTQHDFVLLGLSNRSPGQTHTTATQTHITTMHTYKWLCVRVFEI